MHAILQSGGSTGKLDGLVDLGHDETEVGEMPTWNGDTAWRSVRFTVGEHTTMRHDEPSCNVLVQVVQFLKV